MSGEMNQQRFKSLLKETITLLCSNGLNFKSEFSIEAVIGITIDQESILLLSIQDTITNNAKSVSAIQTKRTAHSLHTDLAESSMEMLRSPTDSPRYDKKDKQFGDAAVEILPLPHQGEVLESTEFGKCTDKLGIKLEQTEDGFERKFDDCSSSSCRSIQGKPSFASDGMSLSCAKGQSFDRLPKGDFSDEEMKAVENQEEDFPGVTSVSGSTLETPTLADYLNVNRTMRLYAMEDARGGRTSLGHRDSEVPAASSIDHILTSNIALPRIRSVRRRSKVLPNTSQDVQPSTGRNRKKSALSPYQCKICGKRIGTLHSLAVHEATVHLGKYRYSCPNCGKGYTVLSNLRAHIACKHNKQKEFACGFCGREYGYKHSLKEHILLVHNGNSTLS